MLTLAALSGPLPKLGVTAAAVLAAGALLGTGRVRAGAILGALVLAPVLLLADIWHSPQLSVVHRHPLPALLAALIGLAAVAAVAALVHRRPGSLAPLVVLALPFRVPVSAAGSTSNLLVPLYLVIGAGTLAMVTRTLLGARAGRPVRDASAQPRRADGLHLWLYRVLALVIVLYGLQAIYSKDFEKALQQLVFFYLPFTLLFCLLRDLEWTTAVVRRCVMVVAGLALLFALIGFVEYATKSILLNPKLVAANDVHAYFTVNSVFFDPDVFGRFLALVMIGLATLLLWPRPPREHALAIGALAVLWAGLVLTLSRSSLAALLVGLGALAAIRWRLGRVLVLAGAVVLAGAAAVAITPTTFGLNQGLNGASSGRADLVSGGLHMFTQRPLWGYGSGAFVPEYRSQHHGGRGTLSASHTIPVTIAAEQGLVGELAYLALVVVAALLLVSGARGDPVRAAIAAAFLALMFHTLLYADFLEDPVTWTLLGIGAALAPARLGRWASRSGSRERLSYSGVV